MAPDPALVAHLLRHSVKTGSFTLKSGRTSSWFIDAKQTVCRPDGLLLVADALLAGLPPGTTALGGLTMGADPVALALMHAAAAQGRALDAFVVRKQGKAHGLQKQIEGPDVSGRRVVAVEDTSTTGSSVLTAVHALREVGAEVVAVAVIVDRDTGAREAVEEQGLPYYAAFGKDDLGLA